MLLKKSLLLIQLIVMIFLSVSAITQLHAEDDFTLYLVRHAEKSSIPKGDPLLTEEGHNTAKAFAYYLKDKPISRVFSTDTKRTLQTAAHYADPRRMLVQKYQPGELDRFARQLLSKSDNAYIVGHSNTTPTLIALLGGIANPISEDDYGDIYILRITTTGVDTQVISVKTLADERP